MTHANVADALGLKGATIVAGFAGAVVSLSFVKELSKGQMVIAVVVGSLTAGYLTPAVGSYMHLPSEVQNGSAFIIGLTAMNIIPGLLKLTEWFRQDPWAAADRVPVLGFILRRFKKPGG